MPYGFFSDVASVESIFPSKFASTERVATATRTVSVSDPTLYGVPASGNNWMTTSLSFAELPGLIDSIYTTHRRAAPRLSAEIGYGVFEAIKLPPALISVVIRDSLPFFVQTR